MQTHIKCSLAVLLAAAASLASAPQTGSRIALNVVAFDSHDQIVGDLTSRDFQVSDQGKPQSIVSFHRNGDPQTTPVVIFFDLQNGNLSDQTNGMKEIIHVLEHLESTGSLYLYLSSGQGGLKPVRGLPNPQEANPPEKTPWTANIKPLLEAAIEDAYGLRAFNGPFGAIEKLGADLKPFPGRKSVIWITRGIPLSYVTGSGVRPFDNSPLVNSTATTLDHDGVTLNPVYQESNLGNGDLDTLDLFAQLTGGKVYNNDIEKAVKETMAGSGSGYTIEYNAPRLDGKYHKIHVTCSRKGVRLQVKQGYYAN